MMAFANRRATYCTLALTLIQGFAAIHAQNQYRTKQSLPPFPSAQPAPVLAVATSSTTAAIESRSFIVGGGDVLAIAVWKEKDLSSTVTVRPDGKITVPLLGERKVAGLTPQQVEHLLQADLEHVLVQPKVTVSVVEVHSLFVYITGEVGHPGSYSLNAPLTLLQLIAQAGGLTEFASRKHIRLIHADPAIPPLVCDYKKMIGAQSSDRNPPLTAGDTVIVQ